MERQGLLQLQWSQDYLTIAAIAVKSLSGLLIEAARDKVVSSTFLFKKRIDPPMAHKTHGVLCLEKP